MVWADHYSWNFGPPDQYFRRTKISVTVPPTYAVVTAMAIGQNLNLDPALSA